MTLIHADRAPARTTEVPATRAAHGSATGMWTLVRFMLRRDRVKQPAWLAGMALFVLYVGAAVPQIAPTEADLAGAVPMLQQPVGRMFAGPGYGLEAPTYARFFAAGYLLYLFLMSALMSIFLITRHTRAEEQSGRAELVRASVVGRHAALTAVLMVALASNVLAALVVAGTAIAMGFAVAGSVVSGAAVGAIGMAFAGITAVTVQLSEYSRSASGLAGAVLGVAFLLRAVGDMVRIGGSPLSWLSPLGWGAQSAPYVLDRWWPLLLDLALAAVTIAAAYWLQSRRDLGASLVAARPGRASARALLGTPWGLAMRLQWGAALAWGSAVVLMGVVDGLFTQTMIDSVNDLPPALKDMFGAGLTDGYLAFLAIFSGYLTAAYVVFAVLTLRREEARGRAEAVLATPTSRAAWAGSHLGVVALLATLVMVAAGALTGVAAAGVTGDWSLLWPELLAHLNMVPPLLFVLGLCALLYGWAPGLLAPVGWALVAVMVFVGNFAALLKVPDWVTNLSPLSYPANVPVEDMDVLPLLVLTGLAVVGVVLGLVGLRRRQVLGR